MVEPTAGNLERALYRAGKALARARYIADHLGDDTLACDILMIQNEVRRCERAVVHPYERPPASAPHCT